MKTLIKVVIDRAASILAGKSEYGTFAVPVDVSALADTQRATLASLGVTIVSGDSCLDPYAMPAAQSSGRYLTNLYKLPSVPDASQESIAIILDGVPAARAVVVAEYEQRKAEAIAAERERLGNPESWLQTTTEFIGGAKCEVLKMRDIASSALTDAEVETHRQAAVAALADRIAESVAKYEAARAEYKQRIAAEQEAESAAESRKALQIANWVSYHGTTSQKARHERGLLPIDEVTDAMRDAAFAPLCNVSRYSKINREEVIESYREADLIDGWADKEAYTMSCEATYASSATDEQFAVLSAIESLMPDAVCTLLEHRCHLNETSSDDDDLAAVTRLSVLVTIQVGEFSFSREYAA